MVMIKRTTMLFEFLKPYIIQTKMSIITVPTNNVQLYRHCLTTPREGIIDTQSMKDAGAAVAVL